MRKLLLPLLAVFLVLWLLLGSWWYTNTYGNSSSGNNLNAIPAFKMQDKDFTVYADQSFCFAHSSFKLDQTADMKEALANISMYMEKNPDKNLALSGLYDAVETNTSSYDNLGIARAETIKAVLLNGKIADKRVTTNGIPINNAHFIEQKLYNGVYFSFSGEIAKMPLETIPTNVSPDSAPISKEAVSITDTKETVAASLPSTAKTEAIKPLNIYFHNSKSKLRLNEDFRKYFSALKAHLASNPKAKIHISGHTDNTGSEAANIRFSKTRARAVRDFMKENGFESDNLYILEYKGSATPIESNDTEEGRKRNRRVEVRIK